MFDSPSTPDKSWPELITADLLHEWPYRTRLAHRRHVTPAGKSWHKALVDSQLRARTFRKCRRLSFPRLTAHDGPEEEETPSCIWSAAFDDLPATKDTGAQADDVVRAWRLRFVRFDFARLMREAACLRSDPSPSGGSSLNEYRAHRCNLSSSGTA